MEEKCNESAIKELKEKMQTINTNVQNNEMTIAGVEGNLTKQIAQTKEAINKLKDISKNKNIKLEEKIKNTLLTSEQIKEELNEQIINNHDENKAELEKISETVENIKNEMQDTITTIGQKISKVKQEVTSTLENHNNEDIELLKKDYNKYVTKVNNELAKISKDLLNAQKKNLEQNRNLQAKIKAYIDAKIEKINNSQETEEIINNLNLSMLEREKLQKLEMEELLNKKLKKIQKENEELLNKKVEEMFSKLMKENSTDVRPEPNNVTFYEKPPKKKKNMYEVIDEAKILKRSASSKNPLPTEKERKAQILKFLYDDET